MKKKENKHIYLIDMKMNKTIKIGRANDSDVRISDISVSRFHAKLKIIDDCFYLEDHHSKFGTLMQIDNEFSVLPEKRLGLQIGKFFVSFISSRSFCARLCCYNYIQKYTDYNDYLESLIQKKKLSSIADCAYSDSKQVSEKQEEEKVEDKSPPTNMINDSLYNSIKLPRKELPIF